jgi:hypothetical protein
MGKGAAEDGGARMPELNVAPAFSWLERAQFSIFNSQFSITKSKVEIFA